MRVQTHPYVLFLAVSALISLIASLITRRRSAPGSFTLGLLLFAMSVWSGSYALSLTDIPLSSKTFWLGIMFISMASVPVTYLIFILEYTRRQKWLSPLPISLILAIPILSLILKWTNGYHHLVYLSFKTIELDNTYVIQYVLDPWYYVGMAYSYAVIAISFILLLSSTIYSGPLLRNQYYQVLLASLVPLLANLYGALFFSDQSLLDLSPISFGLCGILFVYSFFRSQLLDLLPVARNRLIENMSDGVLVLDAQGRIVDINPAMLEILKGRSASFIGKNVSEIINGWAEMCLGIHE